MNRVIKFRVWNPHEKYMYYPGGDDIEIFIASSGRGVLIPDCFFGIHEQTDDIIMQFIGLKDEYGTEIYEGDIIEAFGYDSIGFRNVVKFKNGAFGYCSGKYVFTSFAENYNFKFKNGTSENTKVIGNIYEDKYILILDN